MKRRAFRWRDLMVFGIAVVVVIAGCVEMAVVATANSRSVHRLVDAGPVIRLSPGRYQIFTDPGGDLATAPPQTFRLLSQSGSLPITQVSPTIRLTDVATPLSGMGFFSPDAAFDVPNTARYRVTFPQGEGPIFVAPHVSVLFDRLLPGMVTLMLGVVLLAVAFLVWLRWRFEPRTSHAGRVPW